LITINLDKIKLTKGDRVCDIGCGSGRHIIAISRMSNLNVIGLDRSFSDLIKAKENMILEEKFDQIHSKWAIAGGDIRKLPFPDSYFDLVICSEVLEHINEKKLAINEIIRILKPGKQLIVSVPRYLPEKICWALSEDYHNTPGGHIRIFKTKQLIQDFEKKGLKKTGMHFAHGLHSPYWWLKCFFGHERNDVNLVNIYHRLLVWDIMKKPWITAFIEKLLNPFIGKSVVLYFYKKNLNN